MAQQIALSTDNPENFPAIRNALSTSLYPGATPEAVDMVLAYCKAAGLDPMLKPVHLVPMKVATGELNGYGDPIKETRVIVMPGIGLYRTNASRTENYAGISEPEFGPPQEMTYSVRVWEGAKGNRKSRDVPRTLVFPEWCKITVHKIVGGQVRSFTAMEFWTENYAETSGGEPNSMWAKRPYAQLAKCTEAQALRKAFPDAVGSQPTAEEMEGRDVDDVQVTQQAVPVVDDDLAVHAKVDPVPPIDDVVDASFTPSDEDEVAERMAAAQAEARGDVQQRKPARGAAVDHGNVATGGFVDLSEGQRKFVLAKAKSVGKDEAYVLGRWERIDKANLNSVLSELTKLANSGG